MVSDFGHRPHPRLLVVTTLGAPNLEGVSDLFATVDIVRDSQNVRHKDYDCALLWGEPDEIEEGLDVLQVSEHRSGTIRTDTSDWFELSPQRQSLGRGINYAEDLPVELKSLVSMSLWPALENVSERTVWVLVGKTFSPKGRSEVAKLVHPIATDDDGNALAAWFERRYDDREWWTLPSEVDDPAKWLGYLVERWRERSPELYPELGGGFDDAAWQTSDEREASARLSEIETEREVWLETWSRRDEAARAELLSASKAAESGPRRLLTEQGDELVDAVSAALAALGFDVEKRDATPGQNGPREDLRVRDSTDPSWVAIVEVKGYGRGAKAGDFGQLLRHIRGYVDEHGANPSRGWYVVNTFRKRAPGSRPLALESHQSDIENYGEAGCVLIDTRDLFVASRAVADGTIDASSLRASLRKAKGRLHLK